jgi:cephalosporin hydroxylase
MFFKQIKEEIKQMRNIMRRRLYVNKKTEEDVVNRFHALYYDSVAFGATWAKTKWFGTQINKCPTDLWRYQEIIFELKPDLILETGSAQGGSAFYMASLCDLIGRGKVVSIDIDPGNNRPQHPRVQYLTGSSIAPEIHERIRPLVRESKTVMVILDSDHSQRHVAGELSIFHDYVTEGSFLIVEDSNVNGHPVDPDFGPGPFEAIHEFLKNNKDFIIDREIEKFYVTFNPDGYLRRIGVTRK